MKLDTASDVPLYLQISAELEDGILTGAFRPGDQVPSTTEIAVTFQINPATALKGVSLLAEQGILYKRRGLGMFVCDGAVERIKEKRRLEFYHHFVQSLILEAKKLELPREDILRMIERGWDDE